MIQEQKKKKKKKEWENEEKSNKYCYQIVPPYTCCYNF